MGSDKGLVSLAGSAMIERVIARVAGLGDELIITTNRPQAYAYLGVRMAADEEPGAGALPGLKSALQAARGDSVLLVACDMPFLNHELLAHLLTLVPASADGVDVADVVDVVVPYWKERYQTMHAVYRRRSCLQAVSRALADGERRMIAFYPAVTVLPVEEEVVRRFDAAGDSFFNVNTPEELATAAAMIENRRNDNAR